MNNRISSTNYEALQTPPRRNNEMTQSQFLSNSVRRSTFVNPEDIVHSFFKNHPVHVFLFSSKNISRIFPDTALFPMSLPTGRPLTEAMWSLMRKLPMENQLARKNSKESEGAAAWRNRLWPMELKGKTELGTSLKSLGKDPVLDVVDASITIPRKKP